jgi:hypothetical protein
MDLDYQVVGSHSLGLGIAAVKPYLPLGWFFFGEKAQ